MIFVTVGLHPEGFDRLVRAADEMASLTQELVVIQRGGTEYVPQSTQYFDFAAEAEMQGWLSQARIVVLHGGAGSVLNALQANKPLVIVPRLERFGEVIDDHQLELAEALSKQGRAITVTELSAGALWQAIVQITESATQWTGKTAASDRLQDALRDWIAGQSKEPTRRTWRLLRRRRQEAN
jgi:beta-1,4-N-acetylglucosaminyltransferase